jgi:hypothetical protein
MLKGVKRLNDIKAKVTDKKLAKVAYDYFKKITPKDTGNAKRRTRLQGSTIKAKYPYAKRLDEGWSKQAPRGMVDPTIEYLNKYIKKLLGRK